jgi:Glycosyltransferase 61
MITALGIISFFYNFTAVKWAVKHEGRTGRVYHGVYLGPHQGRMRDFSGLDNDVNVHLLSSPINNVSSIQTNADVINPEDETVASSTVSFSPKNASSFVFPSKLLRFPSRMTIERGAMLSQEISVRQALVGVGDDSRAEDNINDKVIHQFFLTADEERSISEGGVVGYAQPVNLSGGVVPSVTPTSLNLTHALCFHLKPSGEEKWEKLPHAHSCRKDRVLRYTSVRPSQVFSCGDPFDIPGRAGCETGFDGFQPVLRLKGPSFILSRTSHFPHFLEEVADGANWLKINNISYFEHALIDISGDTCKVFGDYQSGSWMPNGSPLSATLQIAALKTITRGIVFSWAIRDGRTVCLDRPWREPGIERSTVAPSFFQKDVCYSFRRNMMKIYGIVEPKSHERGVQVVILQRSGDRVVTNLGDLLNHSEMKALNVTMRLISLGKGKLTTAEAQVREFLEADVLIAHHGAGNTLAALMRPGSLVLELFNYKCTCHYFDNLAAGCALQWKQLFNQQGKTYDHLCNGNNRKDESDNGLVDIQMVVKTLHFYIQSRTEPVLRN